MTSKKIIAFMLTVCMLLSCMPAFAATIVLDDVLIPEDGFSVSSGRTLWEGFTAGEKANNLLIILTSTSSQLFPLRAAENHYAGVTLSFTATCNNEVVPEGIPSEFTVVDAEAYYTRASGDGYLCLGVYPNELVAKSPELSALENVTKYFGFTKQESPYTISNLVIKQGTFEPDAIITDPFTEDTILLSYKEFSKYPSAWNYNDSQSYTVDGVTHTYSNINLQSPSTTAGPYQFFVPKATEEYNVWVQLITHTSHTDRYVNLSINDTKLNFDPSSISCTGWTAVWVSASDNKTITLTEGELTAVRHLGGPYGRLVAIALVPVGDNDEVSAVLSASPKSVHVDATTVSTAAPKPYIPTFDSKVVPVTVNGVAVNAYGGCAAKPCSGNGYICLNNQVNPKTNYRVQALPVRVLPETNTFPSYATVADAIAKYLIDNHNSGSEIVIDVTTIYDGVIKDKKVFVNGTEVENIDWVKINENDVITVEDIGKTNFDPVSIGANSLYSAIGGHNETEGVTGVVSKFCLSKNNTKTALGGIFGNENILNIDNSSDVGLKGCHIVGYVGMSDSAVQDGNSADSKVYFENVNILGYNSAQDGNRIDLLIDKIEYKTSGQEKSNVQDENGIYYHNPYALIAGGNGAKYNFANLYIMNPNISDEIVATKTDAGYRLTTDGMQLVTTVVLTYDENGTATVTEVKNDRIVMFNEPLEIPVAANQKVYVWKSRALEGTTMMPVIKPLLGSNFAN